MIKISTVETNPLILTARLIHVIVFLITIKSSLTNGSRYGQKVVE